MALDLRKSVQCKPSPNDLESENLELKPAQAPASQKGKELSELLSTQLNSFHHGHNSCARQELQNLYETFHSWLQPEKHSKDEMISQLVLEQLIISGYCKDKSTLRKKWESSGRNLEKLLEGLTDDWMKPPVLVHVHMQGQEALFSENMSLREVIVHLKKQSSVEIPTGENIETPFQAPQDILLEADESGDEDEEDCSNSWRTTQVNDSVTDQGNQVRSLLIHKENCPSPEEGGISFENPHNSRRARLGTSKSQEGSLKGPSYQDVPVDMHAGFLSRPNQSSPESTHIHQSNEGNSTCKGHQERSPRALRPYRCEECPKSFRYLSHCSAHQRRHRDERPFVCVECHKAFYRASDLRAHQIIHTREKPFTCSMCEKAFSHKTNLQAHERIHTGEKPYTCSVCQRSYRQSSTYHRHLRVHQKRLNSVLSTPEASSAYASM